MTQVPVVRVHRTIVSEQKPGGCYMYHHAMCAVAMLVVNAVIAGPMSFEDQTVAPAWSATDGGRISVSTEMAKDGQQALAWEWRDGGMLTFADAETLEDTGAFSAWMYLPEPLDESLRISFGPADATSRDDMPYLFEFPLSFTGWRYCTVNFDEDIPNENFVGDRTVTAMFLEAPVGTSGRLLLDLVEFPPHALWSRGADRQVPFINPKRDYDWFIQFDDRARQATAQHPATDAEIADIARIQTRYRSWLIGADADWSEPLVQERFAAFVEKAREAAEGLDGVT
ncbi:MAG: chondroitinase family protein, partial [Armatimonadota bacterium]